jgi:hypothetical protein
MSLEGIIRGIGGMRISKKNLSNVLVEIRNRNFPEYRGAEKSLARPGKKQSTATEVFDFHISCL